MRKKGKLYLDLMNFHRAYERINRETLWQIFIIYDVGRRLLNEIKKMYVNSETCNNKWSRE